MTSPKQNKYDEVPYPGYPFSQSHPDRLATLAKLFGIKPAPVEACHVLELGCSDGGNIIPMAFGLPGSQFFGIDLTASAIARGEAMVKALGLKNITLRCLNILDLTPELGKFDYIIAHGVYSWIPPSVQEKLLTVCKENLAPEGVAYVSYNTYPGGYLTMMVRDMLGFHNRKFSSGGQQIEQARELARFLIESQPQRSNGYSNFLKEKLEQLSRLNDEILYHDIMEEVNSPVYFHQFIGEAGRHGLQYLAEADFFEMQDQTYSLQTRDRLHEICSGDIILKEQYLDFVKCRSFRQTLLCHSEVQLDRDLKPEQLTDFYLASRAQPVSKEPDVRSGSEEEFRGPKGAAIRTDNPIAKAAILLLGNSWPKSIHFKELLTMARIVSGTDEDKSEESLSWDAGLLCQVILGTYSAGLVELHVHLPHFVTEVSEHPVASPLARLQAQHSNIITSLNHAAVHMGEGPGRYLLTLLDGSRDRSALLIKMEDWLRTCTTDLHQDNGEASERGRILKNLPEELDLWLAEFARLGLLIG